MAFQGVHDQELLPVERQTFITGPDAVSE